MDDSGGFYHDLEDEVALGHRTRDTPRSRVCLCLRVRCRAQYDEGMPSILDKMVRAPVRYL
jgi:hypothetical protein